MSTLLASQRSTAFSILTSLNAGDFDSVLSSFSDSPDFRLHFAPASLRGMGMGKDGGYTKYEEAGNLKKAAALVKSFGYKEPETVVQEEDKIFMFVETDGKLVNDAPFVTECVLVLFFEPGTMKISKAIEMVDSLWWAERKKMGPPGPPTAHA
ncbi:hypothetical protein MNV49_001441 [Pseudohyphozyma bogoriensis]|nr:hypothetical protein MNV49_001441 [Pseudohyphozyma bogoriensis]